MTKGVTGMPTGLGRQVLHGGFWNLISTGGQQVLVFLFFIYLARVLDPAAFGVMSLAMMWLDIAGMIGRFGLMDVIVQRPTLGERTLKRMFWWLQGVGAVLMLGMLVGAAPMAAWFKSPELHTVMWWLAPLCLLQNLGTIQEARLRRGFGFKALAARTVSGTLIGGVIGVVFAFMGFGIYSLVMQKVASIFIQVGLLWASDDWRPFRAAAQQDARMETPVEEPLGRLLKMGWDVMWGQLVVMFNSRMTDVLVGIFMGTVALGYLRIAWRIYEFGVQFAIQPLASVALTAFSKMQDAQGVFDRERLRRAYARMTELTALLVCPLFFGLAAVAPLAIPLLFGRQWTPVVPLTQLMSPMALAGGIGLFFVPIMTAMGRTREVVWIGFVQAGLSLLLTALAAPYGLITVVVAHVVRTLLMGGLNLWLMRHYAQLPVRTTVQAMTPAVLAGTLMGLSVWLLAFLVVPFVGQYSPKAVADWLALLVLVLVGAAIYGAVLWAGFAGHLRGLAKEFRQMTAKI